MMYLIAYKHAEHGSDTLGIMFPTIALATAAMDRYSVDPANDGWAEWLVDASMWVVDEDGNAVS